MRKYCDRCKRKVDAVIFARSDTIHKAEIRCSICKKFLGWLPKNDDEKPKRKSQNSESLRKQVKEFHKLSEEFCFICNRKKEELNEKEVLTVDHILQLEFGGKDELENMQILCSACHSHKNWMITYFNKHLNIEKKQDNCT